MKPVRQNILYSPEGIGNGNCLAACLASLLEVPLWMVPPFEQMFGRDDHHWRVDEWLGRMFRLELIHTEGHELLYLPEFYIACGKSARGVMHAVIYSRGQMIHDPHPSDTGVSEVRYTKHLAAVDR